MRRIHGALATWVLLASLTVGLASSARAEGPPLRLALVVAQSHYPHIGDIPDADKEGRQVSEALNAVGFEVTSLSNLRFNELESALRAFRRRIDTEVASGKHTVAFVYFTGHGVQDPDDADNYLLATDADITVASDLVDSGVKLQRLIDQLAKTNADLVFVVADACRNMPRFSTTIKGASKGLKPVRAARDILIAYSTAAGEVATEGVYAPVLAARIRDGREHASETFNIVKRDVAIATSRSQLPWQDDKIYEEFCFTSCRSQQSATASPVPPPALPKLVTGGATLTLTTSADAPKGVITADRVVIAGTIVFPPGAFWIANMIEFQDGATLIGGPNSTVRLAAASIKGLAGC